MSLSKMIKKRLQNSRFIFLTIFLSAASLRLAAYTNDNFWFDEAYTYQIAKLPLKELTLATLADNNPPFYYLLIHFVLKISQNEIIIRLPSLAASLFSIWFVYKITKKISDERTSQLAIILFAISPLTIYLSTEARPHSLAILITVLTIYYFLNLIKNPTMRDFILLSAIFTLGIYTQYYLLLLALPLTWIIFKKSSSLIKRWLLFMSASIATLIPWVITSTNFKHAGCYCPNTLTSLYLTLISPAVNLVGQFTPSDLTNSNFFIILLFASASIAAVIFFVKGLAVSQLKSVYLIPIVILSVLGLFKGVFSPKAFAIFSPVYLIITAQAVSKKPKVTAMIVLLVSTVSLIEVFNPDFHKEKIKLVFKTTYQSNPLPAYHTSIITYYSFCFYAKTCTGQVLLGQNPLAANTISLIGGRQESFNYPQANFWLIDSQKWTDENQRENQLSLIFSLYSELETSNFGNISASLMYQR